MKIQVLSWVLLRSLLVPVSWVYFHCIFYMQTLNISIIMIVPRATFLVFFIVPMPAIAVVGLFAAYDIYKASTLNVSPLALFFSRFSLFPLIKFTSITTERPD